MKKGLVFLIIISFFPMLVLAKENPYKSYWQYIEGTKVSNCIYIAWDEAKRNTGLELPYWGLAGRKEETSWIPKALADGFIVGKVARPNSIAVYSGHVAYVLSVSKDGKKMVTNQGGLFNRIVDEETGEVTIEPRNETGTVFNYTVSARVGPNSWSGLELFGFFYLDVVPGFVKTTTVAGESIPTSSTKKISSYTTEKTITKELSSKTSSTTSLNSSTISKEEKGETTTTTKKLVKEGKLDTYKTICSLLALIILALLLLTTYFYNNRKENE